MKCTKKIVALLLCAMMIATAFPAGVLAADTVAADDTTVETHNWLDFEGYSDGNIEGYMSTQLPDFTADIRTGTGATAGYEIASEAGGNQYLHLPAKDTLYLNLDEDFLSGNIFELSFRVRFYGAEKTNPSIARLLYEKNLDTTYNDRVEFVEMVALRGWSSNTGKGSFATGLEENTNDLSTFGMALTAGTWYNVQYRLDMTTGDMAIYIDGVLGMSDNVPLVKTLVELEEENPVASFEFARDYSSAEVDLDDIHVMTVDSVVIPAPIPGLLADGTTLGSEQSNGRFRIYGADGSYYEFYPDRTTIVEDDVKGKYFHISNRTSPVFYRNDATAPLKPFEVSFDYRGDGTTDGALIEIRYDEGKDPDCRRPLYLLSGNSVVAFSFGGGKRLIEFPVNEWHRVSMVVDPSDDTYRFYLDGELAAYTTLIGDEYTLHRLMVAQDTTSCSISMEDGKNATEVNAALKSAFGFTDGNYRYPIQVGETKESLDSINFNRYASNTNFYLDNILVRELDEEALSFSEPQSFPVTLLEKYICCAQWKSNASLPMISVDANVNKGTVGSADDGRSVIRVGLENKAVNYLEKGTLVISGSFTPVLSDDINDTLNLASVERLLTDGTVVSLPLGTVDGKGYLDFMGVNRGQLNSGESYTYTISINAEEGTATLLMTDSQAGEVANATASIGSKLAFTAPTVNKAICLWEGTASPVNYTLSSAGAMDTLCLLQGNGIDFVAHNLTVKTDYVPTSAMIGAQTSTATDHLQSVRLLMGVDSLYYDEVGVKVEKWVTTNNTWKQVHDETATTVFTSITAGGATVTAEDEGHAYIYTLVVTGIDSSAVIRVTPYTVKDGVTFSGEAEYYSIQAKYNYDTEDDYANNVVKYDVGTNASGVLSNSVVVQTGIQLPDFEDYEMLEFNAFDGSFENAQYVFPEEYPVNTYAHMTQTDRLTKYGGQASFGSTVPGLRVTAGSKFRQPLDGQKAVAFENISGQSATTSGFDGLVMFNTFLPNDIESYLGKTFKIAAYVYMDSPRTWTSENGSYKYKDIDTTGDTPVTITCKVGIRTDVSPRYENGKANTVPVGEWTLVEYEFTVTKDLIDTMYAKPCTIKESSTSNKLVLAPVRPFISFGTASAYGGNVYIDNVMIGMKGSDYIGATLAPIFDDGMVLQRNTPVNVWGWSGTAGDKLEARVPGYKAVTTTVAEDGSFSLELPAMNGTFDTTLAISNLTTGGTKVYKNVGIGEVYYCSGQSNMQASMAWLHNTELLVATADADGVDIRSYKLDISASYTPNPKKAGYWRDVTASNVLTANVSGIGYVMARTIQDELKVPVAIIECYNGGSAAQAWLRYEKIFAEDRATVYDDKDGLPTVKEFSDPTEEDEKKLLTNNYGLEGRTIYGDYDYYWNIGKIYPATSSEGTLRNGLITDSKGENPSIGNRFAPTGLYNGMQYSLKNFAIAGVLWYQGEARPNSMQPEQYNYILYDLIEQWREDFAYEGKGTANDLPVVIFQLAPYSDYYNEIRQTQLDTAKRLDNVYAITTAYEGAIYSKATDGRCLDLDRGTGTTGNAIHPGTKIPVAERAAYALLSGAYGLSSEYASKLNPEYTSMTVTGNVATLTFANANGLKVRDGDEKLTGFRAYDAKGTELEVKSAVISGDTVVVTTAEGTLPDKITYAFDVSLTRREVSYDNILEKDGLEKQYIDVMTGNLESAIGQPAIPFLAQLSKASIYGASVADGKLTVEIRELGHTVSQYKVIVDVNGSATEYTASFVTAGNYVIKDIAVASGSAVTVTLKSADGNSVIKTKTIN